MLYYNKTFIITLCLLRHWICVSYYLINTFRQLFSVLSVQFHVTYHFHFVFQHHKLAHEVGSGSNCLKCGDGCPGLDLHFWRKVCRNCKCKREEHDIVEEDQYKQLDILFNDSKSNYQPVKAGMVLYCQINVGMCIFFSNLVVGIISVLNMIIKPDGQFVKKPDIDVNQNAFKFDWVPPNVPKDLASEYMQLLPSDKLPISGSEGALYRRQQLEKQVPLHDFNANVCHNLTVEEADAMSSYLQNLKENAVGQGLVKKLTNSPNNPLPLFKNMNLAPKPFKKMFNQHQKDEDEFPPPPPELLYPSNSELKPPSTFIGNKNYSRNDELADNKFDNVNNNPAECDQQVISRLPNSNIVRSESLPQQQTQLSSSIHNDNYKPMLYDKNFGESLKSPLQKDPKEITSVNADTCVLSDGVELLCKQCKGIVKSGHVAVLAERIGKDVLWHPQCFVCTMCQVIFVTYCVW